MSVEIGLLKDISLFSNLSESRLSSLAGLCNTKEYCSDYRLFKEENHGSTVYFLIEGEVKLVFSIGDGGEINVDKADQGTIIGCSVLFHPHRYNATAISLTDIKVLSIDISLLRIVFEQDYALAVSFYEHLVQNLLERIVDLRLQVC